MTSLDAKIKQTQLALERAKAKYDKLGTELLALKKQRDQRMSEEILEALKKSGKTYEQLMIFLGK